MSNQVSKQEFISKLNSFDACEAAIKWVESVDGDVSAIWNKCERADWMLWLLAKLELDRPTLVRLACLCARTALKYVPADELRPLQAIEAAEAWTRSEATLEQVKAAADAAAYAVYAAAANAAAAAAYAAAAAAYAAANTANTAYAAAAAAAYAADDAANITMCNLIRDVISIQTLGL